jgi:hypothetical protein
VDEGGSSVLGSDAGIGTDGTGVIHGITRAACLAKLRDDWADYTTFAPVVAHWSTGGYDSVCRFGRDTSVDPMLGACRFFHTFNVAGTRTNQDDIGVSITIMDPVGGHGELIGTACAPY